MSELSLPHLAAAAALPLLFAITVHEVAHGWMAKRLGDPTAERLGRLTLNPIKHIDPIGTILFPLLLLLASGGRFAFGYAKPVPVTWENLRHPKRDMAIVAAAGPMANLLMAIGWAVVARIGYELEADYAWAALPLATMGEFGIVINAVLLVLNLLPLPPLDGGRVAVGLLPGPLALPLSRLEPYGFWILLGLLVTGLLSFLIHPPIAWVANGIAAFMGLPSLL
jgi:Zn-dependent protease